MLRVLGSVLGIKQQLDPRIAGVTLDRQLVEDQFFKILCQQ